MDDELILPETDTPNTPAKNIPDSPAKPRSHRNLFLATIAIIAFCALAVALIFVIINNPTNTESTEISDTPESSSDSFFYYDQAEFTDALDHAYSCLENQNYAAVDFYVQPYAAVEHMTSSQKYRYYSLHAEMYSESHLNDPNLAQRYSKLASDALESMRKGEK